VLTAVAVFAPASPASAASLQCGWPRCTLYMSKAETRYFAYDGVVPQVSPQQLSYAWYLFMMGHRVFAIQYANRGMCVGFNLSAVPWESQGMFGYRC
jgi:hypothetical protein